MDATKRALNDERYAKMLEFSESLPPQAREFRFAVFEGNPRTEMKRDFRPLEKILYSKFIEQGFKDEGTFSAYLDEKFGPGCYFVEPLDEHNKRLEKLAAWIVHAGDPMDDDDDYDDDRPRGRGRWRRQRYDDEGGPDERANAADFISTVARQQTAQVSQVAKSSGDMMSMLLLQQSQSAEARQAEERRRDEQRAEERRREELRAEERRREQEQERREREEREERRREEARVQYQREEDRRRDESTRMIEASNKRLEVIAALATSALPVLNEMFKKKEDTLTPILLKLTEKKDDPIVALLLKSILDKDSSGLLIQQMGEMQKISASMTVEQMTQMMKFSTTMNETIMKKAIDMMMASPEGKTPEGKNMIEQIMGALQGAAEIVKTLVPGQPQPQAAQGVRVHTAAPPAAQALPAPAASPQAAAPPQPGQPAQGRPVVNPHHPDGRPKTPAEIRWESMTPEEQAKEQASMPTGTIAVLMALKAIHTRQYGNQAEYQQLVQFLVTQMPLDLRVAVLNGDELGVAAITTPVAQKEKEIWEWLMLAEVPVPAGAPQGTEAQPSTLAWIRGFTSQLPPSIEAIHGPAQAQRDQLAAAKAAMAGGAAPPAAPAAEAKPAPAASAASAAEAPAHVPAPPPPEVPPPAAEAKPAEAPSTPAPPLAGPGHVPMEAGHIPPSGPPPPMAGGEGFEVDVQPREINPGPPSHLSDHDAP
jgi:hypothetical protein